MQASPTLEKVRAARAPAARPEGDRATALAAQRCESAGVSVPPASCVSGVLPPPPPTDSCSRLPHQQLSHRIHHKMGCSSSKSAAAGTLDTINPFAAHGDPHSR